MPAKPGFETLSGQPVVFQGHRLIPFYQTLRLGLPGLHGGLVWSHPAVVLVTYPDGHEQALPVIDRTRRITLAILGLALGAGLYTWLRRR